MQPTTIKTLEIKFSTPISSAEIPFFRGAVIGTARAAHKRLPDQDNDATLLFHNHDGDRGRYMYPLIQYKRIKGMATIMCLGDGTEAIREYFRNFHSSVDIGKRHTELVINSVESSEHVVGFSEEPLAYRLSNWLPLNQDNYGTFIKTASLGERCHFLEKVLIGNILSFAKDLDIRIEGNVECQILSLGEPRAMHYKEVKMMAFNTVFRTNISLPLHIGLGKGASHGFGTVHRYTTPGLQNNTNASTGN